MVVVPRSVPRPGRAIHVRAVVTAELGPWDPTTLADTVESFSPARFRWWISGGVALELHVGRSWRRHDGTDVGVPYLAPELQLLFKSTGRRPKDDFDAPQVIPELGPERRDRLARLLPVDHPWQVHPAPDQST